MKNKLTTRVRKMAKKIKNSQRILKLRMTRLVDTLWEYKMNEEEFKLWKKEIEQKTKWNQNWKGKSLYRKVSTSYKGTLMSIEVLL